MESTGASIPNAPTHDWGGGSALPPGVEHAHDGGRGQLTVPRASGLQTISCGGLKERIHHPSLGWYRKNVLTQQELGQWKLL